MDRSSRVYAHNGYVGVKNNVDLDLSHANSHCYCSHRLGLVDLYDGVDPVAASGIGAFDIMAYP